MNNLTDRDKFVRGKLLTWDNYTLLFLCISLVYIAGLFIPLMENDAAQFSVMALRMHQKNDFVSLFKGTEEYLDKPHMHFWLSAISYKIFGVHDWAYRIPAILFTLLGAYSTFGLGKLLYNKEVGRLSALIFVTVQAIILANHDVRTDAVLTGATIFGIWQLTAYVEHRKLKNILLGAAGASIAFSTKGQIAVFVTGITLLCHLAYTRKWRALWSWKVLVGIVMFFLVATPMLYAYYLQFDLHPEKFINGKYGNSGVWFILWKQSFERLAGERGMSENADFFFFHHTFLWAFLPWSLIAFAAIYNGVKKLIKVRFKYNKEIDFLTIGGALITFHIMSFAHFKLPHYLNILFPLFAILTARYIYDLYKTQQVKAARAVLITQYVVLGLCVAVLLVINVWSFPVKSVLWAIIYLAALAVMVYFIRGRFTNYQKIVFISVWLAFLINLLFNTNFYPQLLKYQGGSAMAKMVKREGIDTSDIYILNDRWSRSFNFYTQRETPSLTISDIKNKQAQGKKIWIFGYDKQKAALAEAGISWDAELMTPEFHVSTLKGKFLNPKTRDKAVKHAYLLEIN